MISLLKLLPECRGRVSVGLKCRSFATLRMTKSKKGAILRNLTVPLYRVLNVANKASPCHTLMWQTKRPRAKRPRATFIGLFFNIPEKIFAIFPKKYLQKTDIGL